MSLRSSTTRDRLASSIVSLCLAAGSVLLAGCIGSGDDSSVSPPVADSGSADAKGDSSKSDSGGTSAEDGGGDSGEASAPVDGGTHEGGSGGGPVASFSAGAIDFGGVGCENSGTKTLAFTNTGGGMLTISATAVGTAFSVNPSSLSLAAGTSGSFSIGVLVPQSATAGAAVTGSLSLFTNDPGHTNASLLLTATPTGAQLTGTSAYTFTSTPVGVAATPATVTLKNSGNAPATFTIGLPSDSSVTLSNSGAATTLAPGASINATATFKPTGTKSVNASTTIAATGTLCGTSVGTLTFAGQGTIGVLSGLPDKNTIDFGPASCGGAAPAPATFTLSNTGAATIHVTSLDTTGLDGFTTTLTSQSTIPPNGTLPVTFTAPAVPAPTAASPSISITSPIKGQLVLHTDADGSSAGTTIALTEEPQGAILALNPASCATTQGFGDFGSPLLLLQPVPPQTFCVANTGNVDANVTLSAVETGADAPDASQGSQDAATSADAFSLLVSSFDIAAATTSAGSVEQDSLTFAPQHANATTGALTMTVDPLTPLCQLLPTPAPLTGDALGGGPVVTPGLLTFAATCGGDAPQPETFVVSNDGTTDMTWSMGDVQGPGATQYAVSASPPPGLLAPGSSSTITVTAQKVLSPAIQPNPVALMASLTVTTDVPLDSPHVVVLSEVPIGDQLSFSTNAVRFGQIPIQTSLPQTFLLMNNANAGSADANVTLTVSGAGSGAYGPVQETGGSLAAGGEATESIAFDAATAGPYPASVAITTTDPLCTPLPPPLTLSGTGTAGSISISPAALAFGQEGDPLGLVDCGTTGTTQTLTIANAGNQAFNLVSATLGKSPSPFTVTGSTTASVSIGGSASLTITPEAIPATADPNDPTAFSDVLTITTDAAGDSPHTVPLAMQAHGAVIADTPLTTSWTFGIVSAGSIGTFTTSIQNTGNAPATVTLQGLTLRSIFGLEANPTTVPPAMATPVVGEFSPPSSDGSWTDHGQLVVTTPAAFCAPLPDAWNSPTIDFSGASSSNAVVSVTGSLSFPTTECGGPPPGGQSVLMANSTNQALPYTVKFASGKFYTLTDPNGGSLGANGTATILVNPEAVVPGPGVLSGSAPYADDLVITIATSPTPTMFTVPISWTLSGAVLSLPQGAGPNAGPEGAFYAADTTSGFALPIANAGTESASVNLAISPSGAFSVEPAPPIVVLPGVPSLNELVASPSAPACPATSTSTATFVYSGPVCQPLSLPRVQVQSCTGTLVIAPPPPDGGLESDGGDATTESDATTGNDATTENDATADSGGTGGDAGDAGSGAPSPCTSAPCAASGANSVHCDGNTAAAALGENVCTPTEALIVAQDIVAGDLTNGQLDPSTSCYECLVASGGIDDTKVASDKGAECGDLTGSATLTGETATQACLDTLSCIISNGCNGDGPQACLCGTAVGAACLAPSAANGPCLQQEINGLDIGTGSTLGSLVEGDPTATQEAFTDVTRATGMANNIAQAGQGNCPTQCAPSL